MLWFITFVIELAVGLALAWPTSKGCLAHLVRLLALLVGMAAPLLLLWGRPPAGWLNYLLMALACWLSLTTLTLAATGWQALFKRQRDHVTDEVDLSLFDPSAYLGTSSYTADSNSSGLDDLIFALLVGLVGGLIWLGLYLAKVLTTYMLPQPKTGLQRIVRAGLSFFYALIMQIVVGLLVIGFNFSTAETIPVTSSASLAVPINQLSSQLDSMWAKIDSGQPDAGQPPIGWRPAYSPLFPSEWPPTPTTVWVRYAYAYGQDFSIADGLRVAKPWARAEIPVSGSTAAVIPLDNQLEPFGIQGVRPLDPKTQAVLNRQAEVSAYVLKLTSLPEPNQPETAAIQAFYRAWLDTNGAITEVIRPNHTAFFLWLTAELSHK